MESYKQQVINDIKEVVAENHTGGLNLKELKEMLEDFQNSDSITGNGSGSYYCDRYKAREQVEESGILWDDEFLDAVRDYDLDLIGALEQGPEEVDVMARVIALGLLTDEELKEITK